MIGLEKQRLPGTGEKPLDRWLRELMPGRSWNDVRRLARTGKIFVNGVPLLDPTRLVAAGAEIEFRQSAPRATRAPSLPRRAILYADAQVVVVEKPPGISTVPYDEDEHGTLDELVMETLAERGRRAPLGIVHRIDKETSGIVVFTRTLAAKHHLKNQFRFHSVGRRYVAVAHGSVRAGVVTSRLIDDRGDGRRGSTDNPELGREATTHIVVLEKLQAASLIECRLETGRTHQIRIHLSERGHPLVGEKVYSKGYRGELILASRLMLHARALSFEHPSTGEQLSFEQPIPEDMQQVITRLRAAAVPG